MKLFYLFLVLLFCFSVNFRCISVRHNITTILFIFFFTIIATIIDNAKKKLNENHDNCRFLLQVKIETFYFSFFFFCWNFNSIKLSKFRLFSIYFTKKPKSICCCCFFFHPSFNFPLDTFNFFFNRMIGLK